MLFCDGLDALAHLTLLPLPLPAGQSVQLRGLALAADVLLHPIQLIRGHVELVAALVADVQEIPIGAVAGQAHHAHVLADAVVLVDHVVPHLQIGEGGDLLAGVRAGAAALAVDAVDVGFRDHGQADLRVQKAPVDRQRQDHRLAGFKGLGRLGHKGRAASLGGQRPLEALAPGGAARQQGHPPARLLPAVHVPGQLLHVALVSRGVAALELDQRVRLEVRLGAHEQVGEHRGPTLELLQQRVVAQQQLRLAGQGLLALQGIGKSLPELQEAVFTAFPQALRLVEHDHRGLQVVRGRPVVAQQHRQQGVRAVGHAARAQGLQHVFKVPPQGRPHGDLLRHLHHGATGALFARPRPGLALAAFLLVLLPGQLQKLVEGDQVELLLDLALAIRRAVPRARVQHGAQGLPRRLAGVGVQQDLLGRVQAHRGPAGDGTLGHHVEGADGVHLVVEELHAQGVGAAHRVHVQDAAPQGALAPRLHQVDALIARRRQLRHQLGGLQGHALGDVDDPLIEGRGLRQPEQHAVRGHHQRPHLAAQAVAQGLDAAHGELPAGGGGLQEGDVPPGEHPRRPGQQHVQILGHAGGGPVVGRDDQQGPVQLPRQSRQQVGPLGVVRPVYGIDPRLIQRARQFPEGRKALQRGKEAVQVPVGFLHNHQIGNWE